jgi:hypothetical protein
MDDLKEAIAKMAEMQTSMASRQISLIELATKVMMDRGNELIDLRRSQIEDEKNVTSRTNR